MNKILKPLTDKQEVSKWDIISQKVNLFISVLMYVFASYGFYMFLIRGEKVLKALEVGTK